MDAGLKRELEAKVYEGARLTRTEGEALSASDDLAWLGRLAHHRRTELHGDRVTFSSGAVTVRAGEPMPAVEHEVTEVHIVNGDLQSAARAAFPGVPLLGITSAEHQWFEDGLDSWIGTGGFEQVLTVRDLQDESDRFTVFVPDPLPAPAESLRAFAVARLLLDNVPHLRCPWAHGPSIAQLVLNYGADDLEEGDLDGDELLELIRDAGFRPVRRDGRFGVVQEFDPPTPLAERRSEPQKVWA